MKSRKIRLMAVVFAAVLSLSAVFISDAVSKDCVASGKAHSFSSWSVQKEATCVLKGKKTRQCKDCGYVETAEINVTSHKYGKCRVIVPETYSKTGVSQYICQNCGLTLNVEIHRLPKVSILKAKITVASSVVYTGKRLTPAVAVKYGGKLLKANKDYTVSYSKNKAYGTAKIKVTGKGEFTGVLYKSFKIAPKTSKITYAKSNAAINITVKWKKISGVDGYQIKYDTLSSFKNPLSKTVYTSSGKNTRLLRGLKSGKKYYIKIRTFKKVNGQKVYSAYSAVVTAKARKTAKKASSKNVICLTFDDGPSSNVTPKILNTLKENNIKATFFIINYSGSDKKLIRRIIDDGHTLGVHCYSHDYAKIYSSESQYMKYFNKLRKKIKKDFNYNIKYTRFPGGSSNMVSSGYCCGVMTALTKRMKREGYQYFDWNVVSGDADGSMSASYIYNGSTSGLQKKRTNVVLMHDAAAKETTAAALQRVIDYGFNNGYVFKPITSKTPVIHHSVAN